MHRWKALMIAPLLVATASPMGVAHADDDHTVVTVSRSFLKDRVKAGGDDFLAEQSNAKCELYWGGPVNVSRANKKTVSVDMHFRCKLAGPVKADFYVSFDILFYCNWRDPGIQLSPRDGSVEVDHNLPAADVLLPVVSLIAKGALGRIASHELNFGGKLAKALNTGLDIDMEFCPRFNVTNNTDLEIIIGPGDECENGAERHKNCSAGYHGPGNHEECINGFWEPTWGYCDPNTPPGGQTP